jgi:YHS domain-containing protein
MTPLRLLILGVLFYLAWRLLRAGVSRKKTDAAGETGANDEVRPEDVLVEDPVCHVLVPKRQAVRLRRDGVTYYFCSEHCCDQFTGESGKGEQ